jgi:hypothetical protein
MNTAKRFILSLSALLLVSGAALAVPVSARASTGNDTSAKDSTTGTETQTEVETHANSLTDQFKALAKSDLAAKKAQVKEQTQAHRQTACEARKANLTKRMANAVTHAQNHKAVFDKIYTRVQDFYTNKKLNVADYATLKANVDTAQANAAASITALQQLDVSVDCTSQTVADSVSAFQQAVKNTRDSLKAYRASITDLITALKGASTSTDKSSDTPTNNQ